ncbi:MAG: hydrogenase expression/formation protein HypE [Candidatus Hadarchaeum sp.]|uniref:hydrogenase expression/formation protein HypE n=1 Tax=Candidatus Hadarchaeum sp. TaxID=2883567 RepID=UPI003179F567
MVENQSDNMSKRITLSHGAGGKIMMDFIKNIILKEINLKSAGEVGLDALDDGASISLGDKTLIFTTDSHTVKPLFFPGGDIGKLSVSGTINDLAMMGGRPLAMACAIVVEEGFSIADLERIFRSMNITSQEVGCPLITGDFKVMEKGSLDGMIITTTGVGLADKIITDRGLKPGDKIIVTGTIGDHGMTIIAQREGINLATDLVSDVAPLWETIEAALKVGGVTAMKDPTRGGLNGALNEMAEKARVGIIIKENEIPILDSVRAASEMLGIDPLQITNEGKAVISVEPAKCDLVLEAIKKTKYGKNAKIIGEVIADYPGDVILETSVGGRRLLETPIGDPAPRIC